MTQEGRPQQSATRSERVYAALLRAFPAPFRERFGEGMRYAFGREVSAARSRGRVALTWLWVRTAIALPVQGVAERITSRRETSRSRGITGRGGGGMIDLVGREVRHAARRLLRRGGFTATAVTTLALGIGAATAIFSVVEAVILRPLPYPEPDRLVAVGHVSPNDLLGMPDGGYLHYRERAKTLVDLGLWLEISNPITALGEPVELGIIRASPSLLPVLGVEPMLGRWLTEEDRLPGAPPVVVVSHGYWMRHLGADSSSVGGPLLPGASETVVGVLPERFEFLRPEAFVVFGNRFAAPDVYFPLQPLDPGVARFGNFMYHAVGRLAPDATVDDARAEISALMYEAAETYANPGGFTPQELRDGGYRARVVLLRDALVGDAARVLWILLGAVGFVLLIALANVTNLFLVRAEARAGEMAIRRALGAGRRAVALAFVTESVLLALAGGAAGIVLASLVIDTLLRLVPADVPRLDQVGVDPWVVGFALLLSALAAVVLGLAPLLRGGSDLRARIADDGRGGGGSLGRSRTRNVLVGSQVALALALLSASALLVRTLQNLSRVDPGFDDTNALTLRLSLSGSILSAAGQTEGPSDARRSRFMMSIVDRLEAIPGVHDAAFSADLPLDGDEHHDYVATEDAWPSDMTPALRALRVFVGPGYLRAMGAELRSGRELDRQDFADQPRAVVVNESFAEQRWPGDDPLGRRIAQYGDGLDPGHDVWYTVVGVVGDVHETSLMSPPEPTVYLPTVFLPEGNFAMWVSNMVAVVRADGDPLALLPRIRDEIFAYRPEVPINNVETLAQVTARSYGQVSFAMTLILIAAAVSVLLGLVGVYGTVAYVVGRRSREFGLRIALGASGADVRRGVMLQSGRVGLAGIAVGLVATLVSSRVLESLLFGVSASDPRIYAAVSALLLGLVVAASLVPAARAAAVDPSLSMRSE